VFSNHTQKTNLHPGRYTKRKRILSRCAGLVVAVGGDTDIRPKNLTKDLRDGERRFEKTVPLGHRRSTKCGDEEAR